jgi:hypothetical protein
VAKAGGWLMQDFQWTFNGATWGDGTALDVVTVAGLDMPGLRTADSPRSADHGTYVGRDWSEGRTIRMQIEAGGSDAAALDAAWSQLQASFVPSQVELPLVFELPGQPTRRVNARCRRRGWVIDESYAMGSGSMAVEFYASDPRIYDDTLTQLSTGLPTISGGLTFPAVAPFVFGTAGAGGDIAASNTGTFAAPWVLVFTGPLVAPSITHTGQGRTLAFTGTLDVGETLVVDSAARTVLLNGTASRYLWLAFGSQWFTLEPGTNPLQFSGASGTGTAQITYRSASL